MEVNVLGTMYEVITGVKESDDPTLEGCDGYFDFSTKKIIIAEMTDSEDTIRNLKVYEDKVMRHELIHAYLYESGLSVNTEWADNEEIVDWIAIQFPKMRQLFDELNISQ